MGGSVGGVHKTTVYLSRELESRLAQAADRLGRSRAALIREALSEYLALVAEDGGLPPSVGMGENASAGAADYRARLAQAWGRR